jgi:hypothetical protein
LCRVYLDITCKDHWIVDILCKFSFFYYNRSMNKQLILNTFGWGILLWFIGYLLGIVLFMAVPASLIGWVISPIGIAITVWVLFKKIKNKSLQYYLIIAVVWTVIAIVFDYFFLVKLFKPADGYYKLDVYFYYLSTFVLPLAVGWWKTKKKS